MLMGYLDDLPAAHGIGQVTSDGRAGKQDTGRA